MSYACIDVHVTGYLSLYDTDIGRSFLLSLVVGVAETVLLVEQIIIYGCATEARA